MVNNMAAQYAATKSYSDTTTVVAKSDGSIGSGAVADMNFSAQIDWQKPSSFAVIRTSGNKVLHGVGNFTDGWATTADHKDAVMSVATGDIAAWMAAFKVSTPGSAIILGGPTDLIASQGLTSLHIGTDSTVDGVPVHTLTGALSVPGGTGTETMLIGVSDGCLHGLTIDYALTQGHIHIVETHTDVKLNPVLAPDVFLNAHHTMDLQVTTSKADVADDENPPVKAGQKLADFKAVDLNGNQVSLSDYKGKVLVIHFFATNQTTLDDIGAMVNLYGKYKDQGLCVIGVSVDEQRDLVGRLVAGYKIQYPIVFDGKGWQNAVAELYGVHALPTTLLVDRSGIVYRSLGSPQDPTFEQAIKANLGL